MKNKDYYEIPWVKERIGRVKQMLASEDDNLHRATQTMLVDVGRDVLLRVTVTDSFLFQLVMASIFDEPDEEETLSIPGATLSVVDFDLDKFEPRKKIKQWLYEQLKNFDNIVE